ncbi:glycoside hydrolase family 3 protein [Thiohalorhabdus sp.]|uniref:glycoside hydrolase family 3 protein n=1 Tax=Thiohalorhabdus sp. TaxID=3094134 RepID=UPI002FC3BA8D
MSTLLPAGTATGSDLDERIGRMLVVGFRGLEADRGSAIARTIRRHHIGGVVLFDRDVPSGRATRNIRDPQQLHRLTRNLQRAAPYPLLIAVDQEGGQVNRLSRSRGFEVAPSAADLGERPLPATRRTASATARQLAGLGINWNLAPVVDLAINPDNPVIAGLDRAFGKRPQEVVPRAAAVVRAHRDAGVSTALKHFPGHGSAWGDTHEGAVAITDSWRSRELAPYRRLIDRGLAESVMVGHLWHGRLDDRWPASLSPATVKGLLREELGFGGVVVSDDLQMAAIREKFGLRTVILQALRADVDLFMFANNTVYEPDIAARSAAIIHSLVATGAIPEARIDRSFRRIRRFTRGIGKGLR